MIKNVLVIGGTGFIGTECILHLLKDKNYIPISFSRHENTLCKYYTGNVDDYDSLEKVYIENRIDVTLILYGYKSIANSIDLSAYSSNEIVGMINILKCCEQHGCNKVVYLSSSALYSSGTNLMENSKLEQKSYYAFTKYTNENLLKWYKKYKKIDYVILRCFNVVGKTENNVYSNDIINLAIKKKAICIFGKDFNTEDGTLIRDYVHVNDVAFAVLKAIEYNKSDVFNVASGSGYSIKQIINLIVNQIKEPIKVTFSSKREFDQDALIADISKTKSKLGWEPKYSIDDIIKSMI